MRIKIKVFAALKDYFEPEFQLDVKDGLHVSDVLDIIMIRNSMALPVLRKCRVAVNESFVQSDYNVQENEELLIMPPSSGG
ncbi:MAG: MoaD/ThiS family protein [Cytophagaceae bacterium]